MTEIHYAGYDAIHQSNFTYDIPEGMDNYLLIVTTTPAVFYVDGEIIEFPAHMAVLYPPHKKIWYGASGDTYGNHWLRFSSDESFVTNFPKQGIPFPVADPEYCRSLFELLTWEESSLITTQLLRILLNKLHEGLSNAQVSDHTHELLALRRRISSAPEFPWNVSDMAEELHLSTGYLQFLYKQQFDISCMDDVINFRLLKARDYLLYTTQSIAEIAELCGYNNTEHFCRQFRKNVGVSPGQYRKKPLP